MLHNIETIYRKLRMNAQVLPPEILILIKDLDKRIEALEEGLKNEETRTKKSSTGRRKLSSVSKREVSSDSLPTGSD